MLVDGTKLKSARDRRALTQEALAHQARVNVRTIQRAECGDAIRHETLADIAAVLGVPPFGLIRSEAANDVENEPGSEASQTQVLKRVEKAESAISLLERAIMSVLDCIAEPTAENMPVLRSVIETLESLLRNPWEAEDRPPLRFPSLISKLDTIISLNAALQELERSGLALYSAASSEFVKVPRKTEEGYMGVYGGQSVELVIAARFVISNYDGERLRLSADVVWPLELEDIPF